MATFEDGTPEAARIAAHARDALAVARTPASAACATQSSRGRSASARLEGDFVLRSGRRSRSYLDKYRFSTDPELLREIGSRLAEAGAC